VRAAALRVGPANDDEFLAVTAPTDLAAGAARIDPLRNDALNPQLAGLSEKIRALTNAMIAVVKPVWCIA
jgi:hypothetical protein